MLVSGEDRAVSAERTGKEVISKLKKRTLHVSWYSGGVADVYPSTLSAGVADVNPPTLTGEVVDVNPSFDVFWRSC